MLPIMAALCLLTLAAGAALAHEGREVEGYNLVVGFLNEPAYEGMLNGVSLNVTEADDHDHGGAGHAHTEEPTNPVEGLEQTLQVEVTHLNSGASRVMPMQTVFGKPGYYKADFVPTDTGQYRFRFTGSIEGTMIDESFDSGPGRFTDVVPATNLQFPGSTASVRELESALRGAVDSAQQAQDTAARLETAASEAQSSAAAANTMAMVGIAVGAVGIIIGAVGAFAALRRKS